MDDNKKTTPAELGAQTKRDNTTRKVVEALNSLKKAKKTINKSTVAREAKIERKTLYNRPDLVAMIDEAKSLMEDSKTPQKKEQGSGNLQQARFLKLREKVKELQIEKQKLLDQNVELTESVLDLQRKVADLEERLYKNKTINLVNRKNE